MTQNAIMPEKAANSSFLTPMQNKSIVDRIVTRLTNAILNGELKPGQRIPTELELCESMQVGRNSVREAIKSLVAMGVLNIRRSEGTFVAEGFSPRMMEPMIYGLILEGGDTQAIHDLRRLMETGVLQLAIEKAGEDDIKALKIALANIESSVKPPVAAQEVLEADIAFHRVLAQSIGNPLVEHISEVVERVSMPTRLVVIEQFIEKGELDVMLRLHDQLLNTIIDRDTTVVGQVMDAHFKYWKDELK